MKHYGFRFSSLKTVATVMLSLSALLMMSISDAQQKAPVLMPQVKNLFANSSDRDITLRWQLNHEESLASIQLYRKDYPLPLRVQKPDFDKPSKVDRGLLIAEFKAGTTEFTDDRVKPGYYYYYRLVLRNQQQQETEPSPPAIALLKDIIPPVAPQITVLKALGERHYELQWQASPSADVVAYRIYRSTVNGPENVIRIINVRQAEKETFHVQLRHAGNVQFEYKIAIAAVDGAGNVSEKSVFKILRLPDKIAPRPPSLLQASQQLTSARLQWQASAENDIAGYRVYRRDQKTGSEFKPLHEKLLLKPSYIDSGIKPLSAYFYRVAAIDHYGNESAATRGILFRSSGFASAVSTPQKLTLQRSEAGYPSLRWAMPDNRTALRFLLLRSEGDGFIPVSGLLHKPLFEDRSAQPQRAYKYQVVAIDVRGKRSPPSDIVLWLGGGQ